MLESIFKYISALIQSKLSFLKVILRSNLAPERPKVSELELYILGNGPSLKPAIQKHAEQLSTKNLLSVNAFPNTDYFTLLKPNYYLILSKGFYNDTATDYNVSLRKTIIKSLIDKTEWPITVFLPYSARKNKSFIESLKSNEHITLSYYNVTAVEGLSSVNHFFFNRGWGLPRPHNVLIPSIVKGINLGFKNIYILGSDHSWLPQINVNKENDVLLNQKHFYDEKTSTAKPMHKNEGAGQRRLHEVLEKFYFSFRSYHDLSKYADTKSCKIINTVSDSFIDAFEKRELKEIFND